MISTRMEISRRRFAPAGNTRSEDRSLRMLTATLNVQLRGDMNSARNRANVRASERACSWLHSGNRWKCNFNARIEDGCLARITNNQDFSNYRAIQHGVHERIDPKFARIAANRELTGCELSGFYCTSVRILRRSSSSEFRRFHRWFRF